MAGSQPGRISLWDVTAGQARSAPETGLQDPGGKNVYGAAFSPDGDSMSATDTSGDAFVWGMKWLAGGRH